ncbi:hypothetical protein BC829DRAFT_46225 [Chytridium lagenaria]|nr:hypothetical protein BC829DRAFT_46225 [Chytridium lagenaria]
MVEQMPSAPELIKTVAAPLSHPTPSVASPTAPTDPPTIPLVPPPSTPPVQASEAGEGDDDALSDMDVDEEAVLEDVAMSNKSAVPAPEVVRAEEQQQGPVVQNGDEAMQAEVPPQSVSVIAPSAIATSPPTSAPPNITPLPWEGPIEMDHTKLAANLVLALESWKIEGKKMDVLLARSYELEGELAKVKRAIAEQASVVAQANHEHQAAKKAIEMARKCMHQQAQEALAQRQREEEELALKLREQEMASQRQREEEERIERLRKEEELRAQHNGRRSSGLNSNGRRS